MVLVFLVIIGSRLASWSADPTFSADLSVGYTESNPHPWLASYPSASKTENSPFLAARFSVLSLLYSGDGYFSYIARRNETFSSIAAKLGLEVSVLQKANPKIKRINAGQQILVPAGD